MTKPITDNQIKNLTLNGKPVSVGGLIARGATLWIVPRPTGNKPFEARYRIHGKPKKWTLGAYPELSLAEARQRVNEALPGIRQNIDPAKQKAEAKAETKSGRYDVENVFAHYAKHHLTGLRKAAYIEHAMRRNVLEYWQGRDIRTIGDADINAVLDRVDARGAPMMTNLVFAFMRGFFSWCRKKRQGYLTTSPMDGFERPHSLVARTRILSDDEIVRVWRASYQINFPFSHIVRMLLLTGQRRGEVEQMKRSDIIDGIWTISAELAKNKSEHRLPLPPLAFEVIADAPVMDVNSDQIFSSPRTGRRPGNWSSIKNRIDRILAKDGGPLMEPWVWHDLRRTVASSMQPLGILPPVIDAVLNHKSSRGVTAVYQRYQYANEMRHALNVWADHLTGLIDGTPKTNVVPLRG